MINSKQDDLTASQHNSWNVSLTTALIIIMTQAMAASVAYDAGNFEPRLVHLIIGLLSAIVLLLFRSKWKRSYSIAIFILLYTPYFFVIWQSHLIRTMAAETWVPFLGHKIHFFTLACLVPGPYWINLLFIIGFLIQVGLIWLVMNIPHLDNVIITYEPMWTILCALISLVLLYFKYRDQKFIEKLIHKNTQLVAYNNLSRVFLSLRDKMNTPLQSQLLAIELLKRDPTKENLESLAKTTNSMIEINTILKRLEKDVSTFDTKIMSDSEIIEFLDKLEKQALTSIT